MVLLVAFIDRLWGDGPTGGLYRQVVGGMVLLVAFIDRLWDVRTCGPTSGLNRQVVGEWSYWWPL